jgi:hypothetical protein
VNAYGLLVTNTSARADGGAPLPYFLVTVSGAETVVPLNDAKTVTVAVDLTREVGT